MDFVECAKINNYLVKLLSSRRECGSNRRIAGGLNGPNPAPVPADTLTEYVTPAERFARRSDGVFASIVIFVSIFDKLCESKPLTMIW